MNKLFIYLCLTLPAVSTYCGHPSSNSENTNTTLNTILKNDSITLEEKDTIFIIKNKALLQDTIKILLSEFEERKYNLDEFKIEDKGFENQSESTWYFDSTGNCQYYYESISLEGQIDIKYVFFKDNSIYAYYKIENERFSIIYENTKYEQEGEIDSIYFFSKKDLLKLNEEIRYELDNCLVFIQRNQKEGDDDGYSIHVNISEESTLGPEMTVTQTTTGSISKDLYNKLMGN